MFHQLEGLAIDEDLTLADLQGTLLGLRAADVRRETDVRLRPGYFPFTEPSVEVDVSCPLRRHRLRGIERCPTCKGEGWIEILGSGMVDPNVLDYVLGSGYDKERCRASRGMGIERIAMLVYQVPDLRCCSTTTCACSTSSGRAYEGPVRLAALLLRPRARRAQVADRLTLAGDKLERLHVGVGDVSAFVTGRVLEAEQHPTPIASASARSTSAAASRRRSSAAPPTWPLVRPWRWRRRGRSCRRSTWVRRSSAGSSRAG